MTGERTLEKGETMDSLYSRYQRSFSKKGDFCCNKTHCVLKETLGVPLICSRHQKKHTLIVDARECSPALANALLVLAGAHQWKIIKFVASGT